MATLQEQFQRIVTIVANQPMVRVRTWCDTYVVVQVAIRAMVRPLMHTLNDAGWAVESAKGNHSDNYYIKVHLNKPVEAPEPVLFDL